MDWKYWNNKYIFVKLRTGAVYSGKVIDIDTSNEKLIWFTITDKKGERVTFVHTEIVKIKEEKENEIPKNQRYCCGRRQKRIKSN